MQLKPETPFPIRAWIIIVLLIGSTVLTLTWIDEKKQAKRVVYQQTGAVLSTLQSARSELYEAARTIEGGADAVDLLYEVDDVRILLSEARGRLWTLAAPENLYSWLAATIDFDRYLEQELTSKWREDPSVLQGEARQRAAADLEALHADLDELLRQIEPDEHGRFEMDKLGPDWEQTLKRRILENPDSDLHRYLKERHNL